MKKIFKTKHIFLLILLLSIVSCEEVLKENPPSALSSKNFYETEEDALAGLYGAYTETNGYWSPLGRIYLLMGDMNADDMKQSPIVTDVIEWDIFTYSSEIINSLWSNCYDGINKCNEVITYTEEIEFNDPEKKADIIAEAKALRGVYYYQLVRAMGGVPLYTTPTVGFDEVKKPRAAQDEIYDQVFDDLNAAAQELNPTNSPGRIGADIAHAMLARIHLYRGNYSEALTYAKEVINSGRYDLFEDYADVFSEAHQNGIEHIWQIQYDRDENRTSLPQDCGPRAIAGDYKESYYPEPLNGQFAPHEEFINDAPDCYRTSVTISDEYEHYSYPDSIVTMEEVYGEDFFPYYISKYEEPREHVKRSGKNYTVIRYAEILLIAAEALNEVEPGNNDKYEWINMVRERARNGVESDLPDLQGLSQDEFREAVLRERRFELAFEGRRAWDLKRRNRFLETLRALGSPYDNVEEYMLLFPIPDQQVKLNENLEQNEGW